MFLYVQSGILFAQEPGEGKRRCRELGVYIPIILFHHLGGGSSVLIKKMKEIVTG